MMENENIRETYNEMMREKNQLKQRTKKVATGATGDDSDEDMSSDGDEEEYGSEQEIDQDKLRKKALAAIQGEIDESEDDDGSDDESEGEEDDESGSDEDGSEIEVNFNVNKKSNKNNGKSSKDKGIMGLKFMKRGEERLKEQTKVQAKMLMEQIREEQEILDAGSDNDNK